jgi:autotransporter-associated beta strand protein
MKRNHLVPSIWPDLALCALAVLGLNTSQAQVPMLNGLGNGPARNNFTGTIGYTFTTGPNPIDVSALGFVDWENGNGLLAAHQVGIWSNTTLIASVTVPSGTAGNFVNNFYYANLGSPVRLATNTTYTIGGQVFNGGDKWPDNIGSTSPGFTAPDFTGFPALASGNNTYSTTSFAKPATAGGGGSLWNAVNLLGSSVVVPAPVFNPPAGSYIGAQTVTIISQNGSTVFYTTDGSNPSSASANGGVGTGSASVSIPAASTVTINAYATNAAKADSAIASATYVTVTTPAMPIWMSTTDGSWTNAANWSNNVVALGSGSTADFSTLTLVGNVSVTLDGARAIGYLKYGDVGNTFNWTLNTGTGGALTLDAGTSQPVITVLTNTSTLNVVLAGTNGFTKAGPGTLALSANNTYTGGTVVNNGTINLTKPNNGENSALGNGLVTVNANGKITCTANNPLGGGGAQTPSLLVNGGTIDAGGFDIQFKNLTMSGGTMSGYNTSYSWFSYGDISISANAAGAAIGSGPFWMRNTNHNTIFTVAAGGSGLDLDVTSPLVADGTFKGLVKSGAGVMQLDGACTYAGTTTVSNGTLVVGALGSTSTGAVTVQSNAELRVYGTVGGAVTIQAGGKLSGTSGTINAATVIQAGGRFGIADTNTASLAINNSLSLAGTTTLKISKIGFSLASDQVTGLTGVTYGGTLVITNIGDGTPLAAFDSFTLFSKTSGSYLGSFTNIIKPPLPAGLNWDLSQLAVNGSISVVQSVSPPVFTPPPGGYVGAQTVTMTSDTGARIFYTTDGSFPSTASPSGLSPVSIAVPAGTNGFVLYAYATNSGFSDSAAVSATYYTVLTPTWIAADGSWSGAANWSNSVIPNASGMTADFSTLTLGGDTHVTLDSSSTVGTLLFGDRGNTYDWFVEDGFGTSLTLNNGANPALIAVSNRTATLAVSIAGANGMVKSGAGTLILSATNTYTGGTTVNQGVLKVTAASALPDSVTVNAGGSFDWNGTGSVANNSKNAIIAGTGPGGLGALINSSTNSADMNQLTLSNNATLYNAATGNSGRRLTIWGGVNLAGNTLTCDGAADAFMTDLARAPITGTGNLVLNTPTLVADDIDQPWAGGSYTVNPGGAVGAYSSATRTVAGNIVGNGGSIVTAGAGAGRLVVWSGAVSLNAGTTTTLVEGFSGNWMNTGGRFDGVISSAGHLAKIGTNTITLTATNTYTGSTTISNGTLALGAFGSLASSSISVASNATFNVSAVSGGYIVGSGQTLRGDGAISGATTVNGTLSPGSSIGTLTFSSSLALAGNVLIEVNKALAPSNDTVNVTGALTYGGTLTATNIGATPLVAGDSFPVFPAGGSGSITVAGSPGPGLGWSFSPASGVLSVVTGVASNPTSITSSVSGGQLTLSWPADHTGWKLQSQTNALSTGLAGTWHDLGYTGTNQVTFQVDTTKPTVFYRLVLP